MADFKCRSKSKSKGKGKGKDKNKSRSFASLQDDNVWGGMTMLAADDDVSVEMCASSAQWLFDVAPVISDAYVGDYGDGEFGYVFHFVAD